MKFRVGDTVKIEKRGVVTHVSPIGLLVDGMWLVANDHLAHLRPASPAKPPVGAVITGRQAKATPWKRGTVIRSDEIDGVSHHRDVDFVLTSDATWVSSETKEPYTFDQIANDEAVEVRYLP